MPLVRDWVDGGDMACDGSSRATVVLLENCRFNPGEKKDDEALARRMAALCDVYVNDAFGTAHRAEATTHGIAKFAPVACAGPLMAAEVEALTRALANPRRPLVAIVGGAKVSTKLTILRALAEKVDVLIVGGGIANTFILAAGGRIGKSLAEPDLVGEAKAILDQFPGKVPVPIDAVVAKRFAADAAPVLKALEDIDGDDLILDIGPQTVAALVVIVAKAGTIVWNGPVGVFEFDPFAGGTQGAGRGDRRVRRLLDRRGRRHDRGDQQVRRRRPHLVHVDRWRCLPRVPRRAQASRGRHAGIPRSLTAPKLGTPIPVTSARVSATHATSCPVPPRSSPRWARPAAKPKS